LISKQIDLLSRKQGLYGNSWMLKSVKDFSKLLLIMKGSWLSWNGCWMDWESWHAFKELFNPHSWFSSIAIA